MKTIFLTGSSGLLGSDLKKKLKKNYNIINISNSPGRKNTKYLDFSSIKNINIFIKQYGIPEYFVHLGWGKMNDPSSNYHLKENFQNSSNLINTFFNQGLNNFIFMGTLLEYGSGKGSISESQKSIGKLRNYEKGKIKFAKYGKNLAKKSRKNFIHIRLANLYGPLQKKNSLIDTIHQAYKSGKNLRLSPLNIYRDYLFSKEAAIGVEKIIKNSNQSITINLGSGKNISMRYFVRQYWKIIGGERKNIYFGSLYKSKNDPPVSKFYLSLKLLKKITRWYPKNNINRNIKLNIKEFKILNV